MHESCIQIECEICNLMRAIRAQMMDTRVHKRRSCVVHRVLRDELRNINATSRSTSSTNEAAVVRGILLDPRHSVQRGCGNLCTTYKNSGNGPKRLEQSARSHKNRLTTGLLTTGANRERQIAAANSERRGPSSGRARVVSEKHIIGGALVSTRCALVRWRVCQCQSRPSLGKTWWRCVSVYGTSLVTRK